MPILEPENTASARTRFRTSLVNASIEPSLDSEPPHGCTWGRYVELLTQEHGGLTPMVDLLIRRAGAQVQLPEDPQSIERGVRRLAAKGNAPGGQYGRWLLRFFGVPRSLRAQARWMGQYHSRFSDLPRAMCESQLLLWDRPPICESSEAAWIRLGLATVAMRQNDERAARTLLEKVNPQEPAARAEALLLEARLAPSERASVLLSELRSWIDTIEPPEERACYLARCCDQQAYALSHPSEGAPRYEEAQAVYLQIPQDCELPFVQFRRAHGLAYCAYKLGSSQASAHAEAAVGYAGDGGLIRFRVMALKLASKIHVKEGRTAEAKLMQSRAERMAARLQHEDL